MHEILSILSDMLDLRRLLPDPDPASGISVRINIMTKCIGVIVWH